MSTQIPVLPFLQFLDSNGDPLAGGKLYTYESGTVTPKATYTDAAGTIANTNPVILDANGQAIVRIVSGSYTFALYDENDVLQWSVNDVSSFGTIIGGVTGALIIENDLSDLNDVDIALSNLGISPLKSEVTTSITDAMGPTNISGYDFTPGNWVHVEFFVNRNSGAVLGSGYLDLHYDGTAWPIVEGPYNFLSGKALTHGLIFSMSGNQLQVEDDNSSGSGSLITKYHAVL